MGTSRSSPGAPSNVPMVPPWVPASPADGGDGADGDTEPGGDHAAPDNPADAPQVPPTPQNPVAPRGRFGPARTSLGQFARNGSADEMRRGVGRYVSKGLGGSGMGTRRLGGAVRNAGALYGALSATAAGQPSAPGSPLDPALLAGRSANEIMDAVVEAVRPTDGTQDAEAARSAIKDALSAVLIQYEDADLLNLSEDQRAFAIEQYLSFDLYNRLRLDVGQSIQNKAPTASAALARFKEVKDYVRQTVSAAFRRLRRAGEALTSRRIARLADAALQEALTVFEDYV